MLEQIEAMHQNECTFELGDEITYHINQKKAHLTGIQTVHIIIYIYMKHFSSNMNPTQKPAFIQIKCSTTDCVKEMYTVTNPEEQEAFFLMPVTSQCRLIQT